jgi:hypothetical protein
MQYCESQSFNVQVLYVPRADRHQGLKLFAGVECLLRNLSRYKGRIENEDLWVVKNNKSMQCYRICDSKF